MDADQPMNDASNSNNDDDDDPISFLSTLPEPLRGYSIKAFSPPPPRNNNDNSDDDEAAKVAETSNRLDELEISTRSHLLVLVEQLVSSCSSSGNEDNINNEVEFLILGRCYCRVFRIEWKFSRRVFLAVSHWRAPV